VRDLKNDFGTSVHGIKTSADFMGRLGHLKNPPAKWQDAAVLAQYEKRRHRICLPAMPAGGPA
jgi:hypothetical protein